MEPTDEMVEAALRSWNGLVTEASDKLWDHWRVRMHTALRAALAVMPDRYREGWIAGRDAAAGMQIGVHGSGVPSDTTAWAMGVEDGLDALRKAIRNMEMPDE